MTIRNITDEELSKGNDLIAEFAGLIKCKEGYCFPAVGKVYTSDIHSSIDRVISILSRIESYGYDSIILRRNFNNSSIYSCKIRKENDDKAEFEASVIHTSRTLAIWLAVVEFISKHGELMLKSNIKSK